MLLAGLGTLPAWAGTASQPEPQQAPPAKPKAPQVYVYSASGRSYLGVDIQDVTKERVTALKLKEERGVEITMVDQDAPAGKAGLKEHDVILDFNGTAIESEEQLRRLLRETPPGRTVSLGISRDGNPMKISVQLGDRGNIEGTVHPRMVIPPVRIPPVHVDIPKIDIPSYAIQIQTYSYVLGVQTESLSRQLLEYFGAKDGILVRSVEKGSAAEKAGLKAGDVIIKADNEQISDRGDLTHILRSHREGGKLSLVVVRDKHEQTIVVDLPARNSGDSSWRFLDSDDIDSIWNEIDRVWEDYGPQLERAKEMAALQWKEGFKKQSKDWQLQGQKAMREAQSEFRKAQKEFEKNMEKQKLEFKKQLDTWI
jgi:membrane-associated protease RseP (regulator of RpoE activity)